MPDRRIQHPTRWGFRHYNIDGHLVWASGIGDIPDPGVLRGSMDEKDLLARAGYRLELNDLADEGENFMLDVFFRGATAPTNFYIGLASATPTDASTLSTITELTVANGYARQTVPATSGGWTLTGSPNWEVQSTTETFSASGTWAGATHGFLTNVSSGTTGKFIAWKALSSTRTLTSGETLDVDIDVALD